MIPLSGRPRHGHPFLFAAVLALALLAWCGGPPAAQAPRAFSEVYGDWRMSRGSTKDSAAANTARRCVMDQRIDWPDETTGRRHRLLSVTWIRRWPAARSI